MVIEGKLLYNVTEWCVYKRIPFVSYIDPIEGVVRFYSAPSLIENPDSRVDRGFFIGTFNQPSSEFLWIPFELDAEETWKQRKTLPNNFSSPSMPAPTDTNREEYFEAVTQLISDLKDRGEAKTIISRVKTEYLMDPAPTMYLRLLLNATESFTYCFFHPKLGFWMGSTPELLYKGYANKGDFLTIALAGTKNVEERWDSKNIKEHTLVIADIMGRLGAHEIPSLVEQEEDIEFGSIKHLLAKIEGKRGDKTDMEIIDILNPTAAIAGYPLELALKDIAQIEKHDRQCYGGVIGIRDKLYAYAYANIRCVNFDKSRFTFYAGGGILAESDPQTEWEETNRKIAATKSKLSEEWRVKSE